MALYCFFFWGFFFLRVSQWDVSTLKKNTIMQMLLRPESSSSSWMNEWADDVQEEKRCRYEALVSLLLSISLSKLLRLSVRKERKHSFAVQLGRKNLRKTVLLFKKIYIYFYNKRICLGRHTVVHISLISLIEALEGHLTTYFREKNKSFDNGPVKSWMSKGKPLAVFIFPTILSFISECA